ncbi:MAG: hypothetical protein AB1705_26945, partial [Verrucomicrobiota bacterium]
DEGLRAYNAEFDQLFKQIAEIRAADQISADTTQSMTKRLLKHWDDWSVQDGKLVFSTPEVREAHAKDVASLGDAVVRSRKAREAFDSRK